MASDEPATRERECMAWRGLTSCSQSKHQDSCARRHTRACGWDSVRYKILLSRPSLLLALVQAPLCVTRVDISPRLPLNVHLLKKHHLVLCPSHRSLHSAALIDRLTRRLLEC